MMNVRKSDIQIILGTQNVTMNTNNTLHIPLTIYNFNRENRKYHVNNDT
jgi:hypothetical protein